MKEKSDEDNSEPKVLTEFHLQKQRIMNILNEAIYKLRVLTHFPYLLENDGEILRRFLAQTEVDFIVQACQENSQFSRHTLDNRSDLLLICNMLERINVHEKHGSALMKKGRSFSSDDFFDTYMAYAVDILFKCGPLLRFLESCEENPEPLMSAFIDSMVQLKQIVEDKLSLTAREELKRENDLKTAFRASMMLSDNIQELEEQLEKQRQELWKEHDRKEAILQDLDEKIERLKERSKREINRIVVESEVTMMKEYNKSAERQVDLEQEAKEAVQEYNKLLEDHLQAEKSLRVKRLKVETQLASWVAKYDNDIGEKQAEYDKLEEIYHKEQEEIQALQDKLDEQEDEYLALMQEKEEEEQRINEEKAWIFLQNRSARRIQHAWRAYRARKLARKKGKKSKKKTGSAKGKKGDKNQKQKKGAQGSGQGQGSLTGTISLSDKKTEDKPKDDPNFELDSKISKGLLMEMKSKEDFDRHDVVVDLMEDE